MYGSWNVGLEAIHHEDQACELAVPGFYDLRHYLSGIYSHGGTDLRSRGPEDRP